MEGGQGVFLTMEHGTIVTVSNNSSAALSDSPYRTKYGEICPNGGTQGDFSISDIGGGEQCLANLKKSYMNFKLSNNVL